MELLRSEEKAEAYASEDSGWFAMELKSVEREMEEKKGI